ncbi:MAG: hypothetical protein DIU69_00340 [Bacillota bacterium]|nr:MAG: hypothetical protein DIU69_00340 [Bacillota bacterium]
MRRLRSRVAYLKGLAAGLDVSGRSPEGRLLVTVVEAMEAMAAQLEKLDARLGELAEYLGELDQDLYDLEESVAGVGGRRPGTGNATGGEEEDEDEALPADFEGAVVFAGGIPAGEDGASEPGSPVEGLVLECPECGASYAVARDEIRFDRDPEGDETEFEWVCPHCGAVVHDFLPDTEVDDGEEPLTGARTRTTRGASGQQGDGPSAGPQAGRDPGRASAPF